MEHTDPEVVHALEGVAARLQSFRERSGFTLNALSELTGISTSTLSRLETGQRRASLELLLPLARIYRVPLDDLVGAPQTADPRIRLRSRRVNGRTVVPLTNDPGDARAWKIIVPSTDDDPVLRTHDGATWIYVLAGRLRLIVGERELTMDAGEVAEFDTRIPHWFGSDGTHAAEILTIFGPGGGPRLTRTTQGTACIDGHIS